MTPAVIPYILELSKRAPYISTTVNIIFHQKEDIFLLQEYIILPSKPQSPMQLQCLKLQVFWHNICVFLTSEILYFDIEIIIIVLKQCVLLQNYKTKNNSSRIEQIVIVKNCIILNK